MLTYYISNMANKMLYLFSETVTSSNPHTRCNAIATNVRTIIWQWKFDKMNYLILKIAM